MKYRIEHDSDSESPRDYDNLSIMVCFHNRYNLGDKTDYSQDDYNSWSELESDIIRRENPLEIYPLYLYDHSGLTIKIGSFNGLLPQGHAEFDSGQIGYVYVTQDSLDNIQLPLDKVNKCIQCEVINYNLYIQGEVYYYVIESDSGGVLDSCGSYLGYENAQRDALESIEYIKNNPIQ